MADDPVISFAPEHTVERPTQDASRLLLGGPVALVTSTYRGRPNVMPLSWHMPLSSSPALVGIAVEQSRHSAEVIGHAGEFALNFPKRPYLHHVQYLGALRGESIDKIEAVQWETFGATSITAPLLADCAGWVECQVVDRQPFGDHVLFVGLVVAVRVDPTSFDTERREWRQAQEDESALHFLGGHHYATLGRPLEARLPQDYEAPERVLRERIAEQLELSREAREKREEALEALRDEVQRGNVVDIDDVAPDVRLPPAGDALDLSKGVILGGGDERA